MNNEVEYSENVRNVVQLLVEMYKVYDIDLMYTVEFEHEARRYDPTGNLVVYHMMWNLFTKMFGEHLHNDAILGVYNYWRIVLLIFWQYAFDLDETGYEATSFFRTAMEV